MIRGKYLRERKALRVKRRIKLLIGVLILLVLHKVLFNSYSLYESEANSTADIDVAFYLLNDEYETKTITLNDMLPGDTQYIKFSLANFYVDENQQEIVTETDMKCDLKIRTTTNLPLQYELYIDQDTNSDNLLNRLEIEEGPTDNVHWDSYNTMFKHLVLSSGTEAQKLEGITDTIDFKFTTALTRTYILKVTFPEYCAEDDEYQNIIECIEISVDSEQVVPEETV